MEDGMSALARTFVIRRADDAQRLVSFLKHNAPAAIDRGEPLEATVRVHKPIASDAQHRTMASRTCSSPIMLVNEAFMPAKDASAESSAVAEDRTATGTSSPIAR